MKKIILIIGIILILTSCSNSENTKKIQELESKVEKQNELLDKFNEDKKDLLANQIKLEDSLKKEKNKSEESIFNKNIECLKFGETTKYNSKFMYTNDTTRFYSDINNTCIITNEIYYKNNNRLYEIKDSITGEQLLFEICPTSNTCKVAQDNYKNKLLELKN